MTVVDAVRLAVDMGVDPIELDLELLRTEAHGAEHAEPARLLTAATTSRQWVNAKIGYSIPNTSHSGVRI